MNRPGITQKAKLNIKNVSPGTDSNIGVNSVRQESMDQEHLDFLEKSNLLCFGDVESWTVLGTNNQINYSTHGVYRYFGKFPAPIAAKLIDDYTKPGDLVIDPACGSGTTGVEALLSGREALLFDVNPLSVLIAKVKSTPIAFDELVNSISRLKKRFERSSVKNFETSEIDLRHWFLPETISQLSRLKSAISLERDRKVRDFLLMVFASIIRRVSLATTQQGRMFLDVKTGIEEIWPFFEKSGLGAAQRISELPHETGVIVRQRSLFDEDLTSLPKAPLVIYHPPYFNAYKYTSINSLEMAWLDFPRKETRQNEIREFFKVGKAENAKHYVDDMVRTLENIRMLTAENGVVAMMIGDALMQGQHINVTSQILSQIDRIYKVEKVIARIPKYTEATWASSQRRGTGNLGVTMFDFVVVLRAK